MPIHGYVSLMETYENHVLPYLTDVKLKFDEKGFKVAGIHVHYTDIAGMAMEYPYFLIFGLKDKRFLYLPLQEGTQAFVRKE